MPKKRFTSQYSKPASTVHPSLNSPSTSGSSGSQNRNNESSTPSVNELLLSFRKIGISPLAQARAASSLSPTPHTLPPQIRHLLSQPETPVPRLRRHDRNRRFDVNGRRIPAGPAPPRSWLESSIHASPTVRSRHEARVAGEREIILPDNVSYFPGLPDVVGSDGMGKSLLDTCLRSLAHNWEEMSLWERNNLAILPTRIRMALLSYLAVYGPDDGVGYQALKDLLISPVEEIVGKESLEEDHTQAGDWEEEIDGKFGGHNDDFFRLDLGGSIGRSVGLKQLGNLLTAKENNLSVPLPHLTHLSLSHPSSSVSWPKLLSITPHLRTLTHLSLAHWPSPSLAPNSSTTVFQSPHTHMRDVQYGASNYYSRSLDGDYSEGAIVLKRLAVGCYGLEYLDLEGCGEWIGALVVEGGDGIDWGRMWNRLNMLVLRSGVRLEHNPDSPSEGVSTAEKKLYIRARQETLEVGRHVNKERKKKGLPWVDIIVDPEMEGASKGISSSRAEPQLIRQPLHDDVNTALMNSAWEF
ncbi:hypothetical protein ACMFMG_011549 [Clarireedia jacksonii]